MMGGYWYIFQPEYIAEPHTQEHPMSDTLAKTLPIQMTEEEARIIHDAYVAAVHKHFQDLAKRGTPADLSAYERPRKGDWAIKMILLGLATLQQADNAGDE
jgi:hypothetical protein